MVLLRPLIGIRIVDYIRNVYTKVVAVVLFSIVMPFIAYESMDDTVIRFFVMCLICVLSVGTVTYTIGLSKNERTFVRSKAVVLISKIFS